MGRELYHDAIVERSWAALQDLRRRFEFALIGGWAAWIHTRGAKSRDIDIIVDYPVLAELRLAYPVRKNERLKKYEIKADGFDIDIYLPHYSTTLAVPPEIVLQRLENREGFAVPDVDTLLILKLGAWQDRRGTPKGEKDLLDILALEPLTTRAGLAAVLAETVSDPQRARDLLGLFDEALRNRRPRAWSRRDEERER